MVRLEFRYDRVYLIRGQHEVASCGNIAGSASLKIDGLPYPCDVRKSDSRHRDGIVTPDTVRQDSTSKCALGPDSTSTLFTHAGGVGFSEGGGWFFERRFRNRKSRSIPKPMSRPGQLLSSTTLVPVATGFC